MNHTTGKHSLVLALDLNWENCSILACTFSVASVYFLESNPVTSCTQGNNFPLSITNINEKERIIFQWRNALCYFSNNASINRGRFSFRQNHPSLHSELLIFSTSYCFDLKDTNLAKTASPVFQLLLLNFKNDYTLFIDSKRSRCFPLHQLLLVRHIRIRIRPLRQFLRFNKLRPLLMRRKLFLTLFDFGVIIASSQCHNVAT